MASKKKRETNSTSAATPGHNPAFSLISTQKLLQIYSTMVKCRMIDEHAQILAGRRKSAADGPSGNEAVIVSTAIDLGPEDAMVSLHDGLLAGLVRGAPIDELFRGLSSRSWPAGRRGPMPGRQLKSAIKTALASEKNRSGDIAVVFSHQRGTSSNLWRDALAIAKRKMLPMIFVCHSDPLRQPESIGPQAAIKLNSRRPSRDFSAVRPAFKPAFNVDSSDAIAVYRVAHEAIARARKNRGPSLIGCVPYRLSGNSPSKVRKVDAGLDAVAHEATDPILIMESYLAAKGLFTAGMRQRIARGFRKELRAALDVGSSRQARRAPRSG